MEGSRERQSTLHWVILELNGPPLAAMFTSGYLADSSCKIGGRSISKVQFLSELNAALEGGSQDVGLQSRAEAGDCDKVVGLWG